MRRWIGALAMLGTLAVTPTSIAHEGPCRGVTCSGHGTCMAEEETAFCFCDEGFAASALECVATEVPDTAARRRSLTVAGRIVHIASRESQRGLQWVGRERDDVQPLSETVPPGTLWCSDFVAWIYREAGVPFTGGYDGGWHLTNNFAMRRWFQERGHWIDRESPAWATFEPQAGDYVRFDTASGNGHSGIVRYAAGDVLYTVEGNVGQRVRMRRWTRFRARRRLDGFGMLIRADERAAAQRALAQRDTAQRDTAQRDTAQR